MERNQTTMTKSKFYSTIINVKDQERKAIDQQIKNFLKNGGEIKKIPTGRSGIEGTKNPLQNSKVTRQHRKKAESTQDPEST